jgi:hypothetical protein
MDAIPSPAVYQVGDIVEIAGEADPNGEFQKSFSLAKVNAIGPDGALHVEYLEVGIPNASCSLIWDSSRDFGCPGLFGEVGVCAAAQKTS